MTVLRRERPLLLIAAVTLGALAALTVLAARSAGRGGDLDPQNPAGNGAQAVAKVLGARGVQVTVVRRAAQLEAASVGRDTTLVLTSSDHLGRTSARRLRTRAGSAGTTVLVAPAPGVLRALGVPVRVAAERFADHVDASCADPLLRDLTLDPGSALGYRLTERVVGAVGCFPAAHGAGAALVTRLDDPGRTYVVGADAVLANQRITRGDNAAAALRLLGLRHRLVWYVPDVRDVPPGDAGSVAAQLPRALVPAVWLLAAVALATLLWRGRRLGRLVVEPLPVRVRAVESTQGRGRLYRKVRDREHAAATLRTATSRRLAGLLRLPVDAPSGQLTRAVAAATRTDPQAVDDVLMARRVTDDASLTRLAADLVALEREAHQR